MKKIIEFPFAALEIYKYLLVLLKEGELVTQKLSNTITTTVLEEF